MLDPMLQAMFEATVIPVVKQMPTDQLSALHEYLNDKIGEELARRQTIVEGDSPRAVSGPRPEG